MNDPAPALCATLATMYRDDPRLAGLIGPGGPFEVEEATLDGVPLRVFVRAPRTIVDCFEMGRGHADLVHIVHQGERWTFAQVHDRARRLARELRGTFGIGRGDRVAIAMRNLPEFVVSFWAAALNGAIVVPLNSWWTGPELRYALSNAGAKVVFVDPERLDRVVQGGHPPDVAVVGVRGKGGDASFEDLVSGDPLADDDIARLAPDDPSPSSTRRARPAAPKGRWAPTGAPSPTSGTWRSASAREAIISAPAAAATAPGGDVGRGAAVPHRRHRRDHRQPDGWLEDRA